MVRDGKDRQESKTQVTEGGMEEAKYPPRV